MKKMTSVWIASALMLSLESVAAAGYYKVEKVLANNGKMLNKTTIASSAKAPLDLHRPKANLLSVSKQSSDGSVKSTQSAAASNNILDDMAVSTWSFGCTPTSGAMIAGYYDRHGFGNIYKDSDTDMPERNDGWPQWTDANGDTYDQNPLSASHDGLDGHNGYGHVDDYWVTYDDNGRDPYDQDDRTEHLLYDSIADFMKTNMHVYDNVDGATTLYNYTDGSALYASEMKEAGIADMDGAYGLKSFMESRGYKVDVLYNQYIDTQVSSGGFTFENYKAEIDNGHPVMIHLAGHTVVGVGYDTSDGNDMVILYDTYGYDATEMTWGGEYLNMDQESVSIIHLSEEESITPPNQAPKANAGSATVMSQIGESVSLSADLSGDGDGEISSYLWKEGSTTLSTNVSFSKSNFSSGTHIVTLTITDNDDATASDMVVVTVSGEDPDPADDPDTNSDDTPSGGGGGCTYDPNSRGFDLMLLLMLLASVAYPMRRKLFR